MFDQNDASVHFVRLRCSIIDDAGVQIKRRHIHGKDLVGEVINFSNTKNIKTSLKTFVMQNNIFYNADSPGNSMPYNIGSFKHENTSVKNPLFKDVFNNDYALSTNSPAVVSGTYISFAIEDYEGKLFRNPRSIGAVQYTEPPE